MDWAVVVTMLIFVSAIFLAVIVLKTRDRFTKWFDSWFWDLLPNWVPIWFMPRKFFYPTFGVAIFVGLVTGFVLSPALLNPLAKVNPDIAFLAEYPSIFLIAMIVTFFLFPVINFFYRIYDIIDDYKTRHTKHDTNRLMCPICGKEKAYGSKICKKCGYQF